MSICRTCRRPITWAVGPDGNKIALDAIPALKGEQRFAIEFEEGQEPKALPVAAARIISAYPIHEAVCGQPTGQ